MSRSTSTEVRRLRTSDAEVMAAAFDHIGWNKPQTQYEGYFTDQEAGNREVLVAWLGSAFVGYVCLIWSSEYRPLRAGGIPEIQDLNVLPEFRRRGIATLLLTKAERLASERSAEVGIGVGLHPGYSAAQRLYVKRGYVPDGRGVTYRNEFVPEGTHLTLDDDLVMHFTKRLSEEAD